MGSNPPARPRASQAVNESGFPPPSPSQPSLDAVPARVARPRPARPRPAASLVLIDRSGPEPKILLGRRNAALAFLPGKYVFPGGRLEKADRLMASTGSLPAHCRKSLAQRRRRGAPGADAFARAAIRETFEETGLLFGVPGQVASDVAGDAPAAWQSYAALGFLPDLSALAFVARAITPPSFPYRYDTSFFTCDVARLALRIDGVVDATSELVELVWLSIAEARRCDIPAITAMILDELEGRLSGNLAAALPVPFFTQRRGRWRREEL